MAEGHVTSNLPAVLRALNALPLALSPRARTGAGRTLGDEAADAIAAAIRHRTVTLQVDPDGRPLPPLQPRYRGWKVRRGFDRRVLVKTGEMTEPLQLRGRVTATADTLVMRPGLDGHTQNLVRWMSRGDARRNRPARRFYELGRAGRAAYAALAREALAAAVAHARGL